MRASAALLVLLLSAAACGGEWAGQSPEERADLHAALQTDRERIGALLYEQGLVQDREVEARLRETMRRAGQRQAARDSAAKEFRVWLDQWVKDHPERLAAAKKALPKRVNEQEARELLARARAERNLEREQQASAGTSDGAAPNVTAPR